MMRTSPAKSGAHRRDQQDHQAVADPGRQRHHHLDLAVAFVAQLHRVFASENAASRSRFVDARRAPLGSHDALPSMLTMRSPPAEPPAAASAVR